VLTARAVRTTFAALVALAALAVLVALPAPAAAGEPVPASPPPRLADLGWLAGTWAGPGDSDAIEEHWSAPRGTMMLGLHHELRGERSSFEFLRIEAGKDGSLVYQASPGGRCPPTPFPLVEWGAHRLVFANPEHDFPQRILYWLDEERRLHARVEGPGKDGKVASIEWTWTRR
jgi:hypothetical protein